MRHATVRTFPRIPLTGAVVGLMLASLLTSTALADHANDKELTFNQESLLPITADDFSDVQEECEGVDTDVEDGWVFINPPVPRGGFTHLDVTFDTIGHQDLDDAAHSNEQGSKVTFTAPIGSALTDADARGLLSGHDHFVLTHTCHKEEPGFLQVEKFIDVDADGVLDAGDVTSDDGTGNLAGWEFEVYEGSDTSGSLVDTLVTDSNGEAGPIALAAGTYTVLESNTGKTITTDVTGGSLTEITTDNPVTDGVIAGETTTYTFGNACLITKMFQVTGVPAGTTGLQARYDTDLDDEVSGADVVTVALADQGSGVHSGTATELFQIGDALEWEYVHTGTGSSEFVGSETFGLADGYPSCLRTNTVEFAPPTVTVNKFKDILADGLTADDTQGLANWQFNLWLDGGDGVFGGDDTFIETLTTDGTGSVKNTVDLAPGDYHVEEILQPNWVNTTPGGDPAVISVTLDIGEDETVNFANAPEARFDVRFFDLTGFTNAEIDCDTAGTDTHDESATPETTFESDNVTVGTYTCTIVIVDP